jgi:hypothetical protein
MNSESTSSMHDKDAQSGIHDSMSDFSGIGIYGDSTSNELAMTRIWIEENKITKLEIRVIGSELSNLRASRIEKQLKNKSIHDIELMLDYDLYKEKFQKQIQLDHIYESIIRCIDAVKKRGHEPQSVSSEPESPRSELQVEDKQQK